MTLITPSLQNTAVTLRHELRLNTASFSPVAQVQHKSTWRVASRKKPSPERSSADHGTFDPGGPAPPAEEENPGGCWSHLLSVHLPQHPAGTAIWDPRWTRQSVLARSFLMRGSQPCWHSSDRHLMKWSWWSRDHFGLQNLTPFPRNFLILAMC